MHMHWTQCICICIGQNIKSRKRPSVRRLWTRMWRNLWTDLYQIWHIASPYLTGVKFLCAVRLEVLYAHARRLTDRHPQLSSVYTDDSPSNREIKLLLCGLFQWNGWISIRYDIWYTYVYTDFSYTNFTVGLSNVDALDRLDRCSIEHSLVIIIFFVHVVHTYIRNCIGLHKKYSKHTIEITKLIWSA